MSLFDFSHPHPLFARLVFLGKQLLNYALDGQIESPTRLQLNGVRGPILSRNFGEAGTWIFGLIFSQMTSA